MATVLFCGLLLAVVLLLKTSAKGKEAVVSIALVGLLGGFSLGIIIALFLGLLQDNPRNERVTTIPIYPYQGTIYVVDNGGSYTYCQKRSPAPCNNSVPNYENEVNIYKSDTPKLVILTYEYPDITWGIRLSETKYTLFLPEGQDSVFRRR